MALAADERMRGTVVPRSGRGTVVLDFLCPSTIFALWGTLLALAAVYMHVRGPELPLPAALSALTNVLPLNLPGQIFLAVGIGLGALSIAQSDARLTISALRGARPGRRREPERSSEDDPEF